MSKAGIPIRINATDDSLNTNPQINTGVNIGERELFFQRLEDDTYKIWFGSSKTNVKGYAREVVSGISEKSLGVENEFLNLGSKNEIVGFTITKDDNGNIILTPNDTQKRTIFNQMNLNNVEKIVLSESMYGQNLPESGVDGQLFFKI